jgi:hypothetical protein
MTEKARRPTFVTDEHLQYLDNLRESGECNMFGARPYLTNEFPDLDIIQAMSVLNYWMETFDNLER